ncbi:MAG: hypothetical protein ACI4ES_13605 [Roseburia sp.]
MGRGSYTAADWQKLKNSRNITADSNASELFQKSKIEEKFNPRYINVRESCDSEDSPEATPIILGFDVTGSMGYLAEEIAKNALNETITYLYEKQPVTNPHVLVAAIGDSKSDEAPLQVTQFEADIRIAEQLLDLWLEGRGGGNGGESYSLAWYFADRHTKIDSFEKRNKKGFLFTIGDEPCHGDLSHNEILRVFDDQNESVSSKELFEKASEKYEIFHIILKNSYNSVEQMKKSWEDIIGKRYAVVNAANVNCISQIITSIMQIVNGVDKNEVMNQWDIHERDVVAEAIATIDFKKEKKKRFLFF